MMLAHIQRDMRAWLDRNVQPRFGARAAAGLRVYRNTYRAQLVACLEASFPHTRDWIGPGDFHDAVVAHVARVPPSSWTLDAYPRDFPVTLALRFPADPEVAELAVLELALDEAFVGPDAAPLTVALDGIDWDRARLTFVPTLDLRPLTTNAPAIWTALTAGDTPPAAERLDQAGALLIWRHDSVARFRALDQVEQQAILLVRSGMGFAQLCAALVDLRGEADGIALAGGYLGQWIGDGLLTAITEGEQHA